MTMQSGSQSPPGAGGKPQQAKEQASRMGQQTAQAGGQMAHQIAGQGKQVAAETRRQARNLMGEATDQLRQQAGAQQKRAADGLRSIGNELRSMAGKSEHHGMASEMVSRASGMADQAAGWIEQREPGDLVHEVRDYARRHPGTFLAGAIVAGLLAGRFTRNVAGADHEEGRREDGHRPEYRPESVGLPPESTYERPVGEPTGIPPVPGSEVTR